MNLIHKRATPKALAANRANALLSTGPRSQAGKFNTGRNRLEHGIFAKALDASIKELGEDPADYESLRRGLLQSFAPEDGFEEMLVEELAQIAWRRQRLMRAESGVVAAKRREYEIDRALEGSGHAGGVAQFAGVGVVPTLGLLGLPDSVDKCDRILEMLRSLKIAVREGGFTPGNLEVLDYVYGKCGSMAGVELKARYIRNLKLAQSGKKGLLEMALDRFLSAVDDEINAFEELRKIQARNQETTQTMKDAQLLPSAEDLAMILRYEAGLARQFKFKLKQLVGWRRAKKGVGPLYAAQPETGAGEPTHQPERALDTNPVPCLEGSASGDNDL